MRAIAEIQSKETALRDGIGAILSSDYARFFQSFEALIKSHPSEATERCLADFSALASAVEILREQELKDLYLAHKEFLESVADALSEMPGNTVKE